MSWLKDALSYQSIIEIICINLIGSFCILIYLQLSDKFGSDFDKYLIRELVEQIDLKDPNKVSKDKNEAVKSQLLA